jgi:hypothetical protein
MAVFPALPGLWLGLTLVTNQVPNGGWIALEVAVAAWGILAWRTLSNSVTLTGDTLVIRNILTTRRVLLADVTGVAFRRGKLTVTTAPGAAAAARFTVSVANLGISYWSGLRDHADAVAEAIAGAAGLPPPPPRREIISRNWARVLVVAGVACFGLGIYCGPLLAINDPHGSLALHEAGAILYSLGIGVLGPAFRIARDHRRKRAR